MLCVPKSPNTPPPPPPPSQQQIAQQAKQQSALKQLEGMGCTQQIITETCPTENSYLLCREYVANHSLSAGFGCKGPGLIEKEYASADKALMSMGCSHLLGRVSDYICPDSSSYNLCKTYRGNGVVTNCRLK